MPIPTLAERCVAIREAAGYGNNATAFAKLIGIRPPSLFGLENGTTRTLGKAWSGYIKIGANPEYLRSGRGLPMLKGVEKHRRVQVLAGEMEGLEDRHLSAIEQLVASYKPVVTQQQVGHDDPGIAEGREVVTNAQESSRMDEMLVGDEDERPTISASIGKSGDSESNAGGKTDAKGARRVVGKKPVPRVKKRSKAA